MSLKQELFDRISKHLLNQNERSVKQTAYGDSCCYRGDNGLKCAVGAIISDKKYSEKIEGRTVYTSSVIECLPVRYQGVGSISFIGKLQRLHDMTPVSLWKESLKEIAAKHNLVVNF